MNLHAIEPWTKIVYHTQERKSAMEIHDRLSKSMSIYTPH